MTYSPPAKTAYVFAGIVFLAMSAGGCANWKEDRQAAATQLPKIRENARSIVLSVEFLPLTVDPGDRDRDASLWQWVDETAIDVASRRRWMANGLRIGRIANEERFRSKLETVSANQDVVDKFLAEASVASDLSHSGKRIPMRLGRRYELPLRQPVDGDQVMLVRLGEETIGRTLSDPQCLFAVTANPGKKAVQVHVRLRPEIQFGEMRQQWITSDLAWRIDRRRETWSIDELDVELTGGEGDTFVVAGVNPLRGLAQQMLRGSGADASQQQVVVLIKVEEIPDATDLL